MDSKAQTTFDFAIGMSVFVLATAFVFAFVPGMLQPFDGSTQEELAASDRIADDIALRLLGTSDATGFDSACTVEFFRDTPTETPTCPFDQSVDLAAGDRLVDRLALDRRLFTNVALYGSDADGDGNRDLLCADTSSGTIAEQSTLSPSSCDVVFRVGTSVPDGGAVVTSSRAVTVDGIDATLEVSVW